MKQERKNQFEKERRRKRRIFKIFKFLLFQCFVFVFFIGENTFAQNFEVLAEQLKFGTAEIKRNALFQIRNLENENASRLAIPALKDEDEIIRATAIFSVVFLPKDEALTVILPLLSDKSEIVRREAAYALGKIRNTQAVIYLVQAFGKERGLEVKNACIIALGEIGDMASIELLMKILKQKPSKNDEFLRRSAARSIGQIAQIIQINKSQVVTPKDFLPDKYKEMNLPKYSKLTDEFPVFRETLPILIRILQNLLEAQDVRREAAFALGAIGDDGAVPILQANLTDKDYYLAEICKESLKKIQINSLNR